MNVMDLNRQLKTERKPLYIIKGSDTHFKRAALGEFKNLLNGVAVELNYNSFQAAANIAEIVNALNVPPFLSDVRLVIWFGDDKKAIGDVAKQTAALLAEYLKSPNPGAILVLVEDSDYFLACYKLGEIIDCSKLDTSILMKIVSEKVEKQGYAIDNALIKEIIARADNDMETIINELTKAYAYAFDSKVINAEVVSECLIANIEQDIFRLSDYIVFGKTDEAYRLLNYLLMRGEEPLALLSLITAHFRRMFLGKISKLSNEVLSQQIGCRPYALKVARDMGVKYKPMQLKKILDELQNVEFDCKQGKLAIDDGLQKAVCIALGVSKNC